MRSSKPEVKEFESTVATVGRCIIFTGPIDTSVVGEFLEQLYRLAETDEPIRIKLMSPGGEVGSGFAMYDAIRGLPIEVITEAYGEVSSMAALVFLAGDRRYVAPECRWMAHRGTIDLGEKEIQTALNRAKEAMVVDERYTMLISERAKMGYDLAKDLVFRECFLDAKSCVQYGIAHEILGNKP